MVTMVVVVVDRVLNYSLILWERTKWLEKKVSEVTKTGFELHKYSLSVCN